MALTQIPPVMIDGELGLDWQSSVETSSFTAVTGNGYFVNTTSGSITVTMPSSPIVGDSIGIIDYAGTASTNKIILTSSNNIEGASAAKVVNYTRGAIRISYSDVTQGWVVSAAANEGTSALNPNTSEVDFLVVAGGAGGGQDNGGGGGGAGGLRTSFGTSSGGGTSNESKIALSPGTTYTITVGPGGGAQTSGTNSSIVGGSISVISTGGGRAGGQGVGNNGADGGSGGGATPFGSGGAAVTSPVTQGYAGANGLTGSSNPYDDGGGGGGGAGGAGQTVTPNKYVWFGAGPGLPVSITGTSITYAVGGNGTPRYPDLPVGGATPGAPNTGDGGDGAGRGGSYAAAGGSGIVVLRMPTANYSGTTTGTVTVDQSTVSGVTILKFTGDGTYTH